jgi:hypothetical protein
VPSSAVARRGSLRVRGEGKAAQWRDASPVTSGQKFGKIWGSVEESLPHQNGRPHVPGDHGAVCVRDPDTGERVPAVTPGIGAPDERRHVKRTS